MKKVICKSLLVCAYRCAQTVRLYTVSKKPDFYN